MSKPLNSLLPNSLVIPSVFPGILPHFPPQPLYKFTLGFIFMEIQSFLSTLCSPKPLCFAHTVPVIWKSPFPSSIFYMKASTTFKALPRLPYTMLLIPCDRQLYTLYYGVDHRYVNCVCSFLHLTADFLLLKDKVSVLLIFGSQRPSRCQRRQYSTVVKSKILESEGLFQIASFLLTKLRDHQQFPFSFNFIIYNDYHSTHLKITNVSQYLPRKTSKIIYVKCLAHCQVHRSSKS